MQFEIVSGLQMCHNFRGVQLLLKITAITNNKVTDNFFFKAIVIVF